MEHFIVISYLILRGGSGGQWAMDLLLSPCWVEPIGEPTSWQQGAVLLSWGWREGFTQTNCICCAYWYLQGEYFLKLSPTIFTRRTTSCLCSPLAESNASVQSGKDFITAFKLTVLPKCVCCLERQADITSSFWYNKLTQWNIYTVLRHSDFTQAA